MAALRTMIGRIYGPVEALQAFNAIHANLGAFLSDPQKAELIALINVQGAIMQTGHGRTQEWSQDFWVRLPVVFCTHAGAVQVLGVERLAASL